MTTQTTDIRATLKNEILTLNDRQAAYVLQRLKEMKRDFASTEDAFPDGDHRSRLASRTMPRSFSHCSSVRSSTASSS